VQFAKGRGVVFRVRSAILSPKFLGMIRPCEVCRSQQDPERIYTILQPAGTGNGRLNLRVGRVD
jgi:hypothetical protein